MTRLLTVFLFSLALAAFNVSPALAKSDSRSERFRESAVSAAEQFGVPLSDVQIRIVSRHHEMLGGIRHARAVIYVSGRRVMFVSDQLLVKPSRFQREILQHEFSHFAAWSAHGTDILEHGNQWRKLCLARATDRKVCATIR